MSTPLLGSRWKRKGIHDPKFGPVNGYTVRFITNITHTHPDHPPQVVFQGDNCHWWSNPAESWPPNNLTEMEESS